MIFNIYVLKWGCYLFVCGEKLGGSSVCSIGLILWKLNNKDSFLVIFGEYDDNIGFFFCKENYGFLYCKGIL